MGDLLRGVRVLGPVLRLMGRYRAATWVSLVLCVGWFVLGLGSDAHAGTGADPVLLSDTVQWRTLAEFLVVGTVLTLGAVGTCVAFFVGVCWLVNRRVLRNRRDAVRGVSDSRISDVDPSGSVSDRSAQLGHARHPLGRRSC